MSKPKKTTVEVKGTAITILSRTEQDYISLTDIARFKDSERSDYIIQNWLRTRNTIEFLGIWERLNNPGFNSIEFDGIRNQAGLNSFVLTAKRWIDATHAVGLISTTGRYGGTFAHVPLFGQTAKQWRDANQKLEGNMREYATVEQLLVLANIEGMNAEFIHMNLPQSERLKRLNQIAIRQMQTLTANTAVRQIGGPKEGKE
jgi:hypothetical protein